MAGKAFAFLFLLFLLLGVFRTSIIDGIEGWRTTAETQGAAITTGATDTAANVTLSGDLFLANVSKVTGITSNVTGDAPVASTYTEATNVLLVSGLISGATHSLTLAYKAEAENVVMRLMGPFLNIIIFGLLIGGCFMGTIGTSMFKRGR